VGGDFASRGGRISSEKEKREKKEGTEATGKNLEEVGAGHYPDTTIGGVGEPKGHVGT